MTLCRALILALFLAPNVEAVPITFDFEHGGVPYLTVTLEERDGGVYVSYITRDPWSLVEVTFEGGYEHSGPPAFHAGWSLEHVGLTAWAWIERPCGGCVEVPEQPEGPERPRPEPPCRLHLVAHRQPVVPVPEPGPGPLLAVALGLSLACSTLWRKPPAA